MFPCIRFASYLQIDKPYPVDLSPFKPVRLAMDLLSKINRVNESRIPIPSSLMLTTISHFLSEIVTTIGWSFLENLIALEIRLLTICKTKHGFALYRRRLDDLELFSEAVKQ
jgi:hypothetical protein